MQDATLPAISDFSLRQLRHHLIEEDFSFKRDDKEEFFFNLQHQDFFHKNDKSELKIYRISKVDGDDWKIVMNWPDWYDTRDEKFGSGAVELTMHLMKLDFDSVVELLSKTPAPALW